MTTSFQKPQETNLLGGFGRREVNQSCLVEIPFRGTRKPIQNQTRSSENHRLNTYPTLGRRIVF